MSPTPTLSAVDGNSPVDAVMSGEAQGGRRQRKWNISPLQSARDATAWPHPRRVSDCGPRRAAPFWQSLASLIRRPLAAQPAIDTYSCSFSEEECASGLLHLALARGVPGSPHALAHLGGVLSGGCQAYVGRIIASTYMLIFKRGTQATRAFLPRCVPLLNVV